MKKLTAMFLALMLILSFCACGDKDVSGTVTPQESQTGAASTVEEPEAEFQLGVTTGGKYENKFLGIGCSLDDSWTFASQEELAQMVGTTADMFDDEKYAEQMKNIDMFYDMYAAADEGLVTINVVIQNLGVLYGAAISEEKFIELSLEGLDEQLGSAGFVLQGSEVGTMTFAGEERTALHISCTYQDVPYYCQQIIIKQGEYMSIITLASFYEDNTASMVDYFYAVG